MPAQKHITRDGPTPPESDIPRPAHTNDLPDNEAFHSTAYDLLVLEEISFYIKRLGLTTPVRPTASALLTVLRHAEQISSGYQRHLLGYAAANLDAATWVGQDSEEGRSRLVL